MNEKLKEFFRSKKEVFVFLGLLVATFVAVIAIAEATVFPDEDDVVDAPTEDQDEDLDTDDEIEPETIYKFVLPTLGNQIIVREFFDLESTTNSNSIIVNGDQFTTSKGIGYANEDNSAFDVVCIFPGEVIDIDVNEVMGTTITIDHGNDLISTYYSLSNTTVELGDKLNSQDIIGTAGASNFDIQAGVHVHVEIELGTEYINLTSIIGKTFDEVVSTSK